MSYPILYNANETNFEHLGISVLSDAIECRVTSERNGLYILELKYPIDGKDFLKIKEGMILKADAGYRTKNQRFIISKITVNSNKVAEIYAKHISQVKTVMNALKPNIVVTTASAQNALDAWRENLLDEREKFYVWSDILHVASANWSIESFENSREVLGGKAGSILDIWGGEYEFDNLRILLHKNRGQNTSTIIAYGRNLKDLEQEKSILDTYTAVYPFKKYNENDTEKLLVLPELIVESSNSDKFSHKRILKLDLSSNESITNEEQLRNEAKRYIKTNNIGFPEVNLKLSYVDLSKVSGLFETPHLEKVDLCDKVKVYFEDLGITNEEAKITKIIWDVLLDENYEIELGETRKTMSESIGITKQDISDIKKSISEINFDEKINQLIAEQEAIFERERQERTKEIETTIKDNIEKARIQVELDNEALREQLNTKIEAEANKSQELIDEFKQSFDGEKQELLTIINSFSLDVDSELQNANRKIDEHREEATRLTNEIREEANNLGRNINGLRANVEQTNRGLREDITRINQKFDNAGNLVELARYKTEREATDRDVTTKLTELQLYKDGEAERAAVIENKIIESARGTEQKISETYSNLGINYFRNTKTFTGDWYQKTSWLLEPETNNGFSVMSRATSWQGISQSVYSEAEQWWTYSADVKGIDTSGVVFYTVHGGDSATVVNGVTAPVNVTNEFVRFSHSFKVGTAGFIRPRIEKTNASGKLYISKIKLEKGRVATPWIPHVDDNETYTSDRLVTINNDINGIRTTISAVDSRVGDVASNLTNYKSEREQTDRATREQLTALNTYMNADGTRQTNILSLAERKTAELISREMTNVSQNYVANSVLDETVRGIDRKFSEIKIGGRNYIRDYGSFARGVTSSISPDWKYELINDNQAKSGKCVKFTALKNSRGPWLGGFDFLKNQEFQNKQMTWSLDIKSNKTFTTNKIGFETGGLTTKTITTEFQRIHHTFINKFTTWWSFVVYGYTFSQGDVIYIRDPQLEDGSVPTSPRPAPEDNELIVNNKIAEYRQTVDGQIATVRGIANDGKALATRVEQDLAGIRTSVSSLSGDVFKKSEFRQTDDKITLATGYEIDGRKLGSMISLSPDGIKAVADKMIITADNENLIPHQFRTRIELRERFYWFGARYKQALKANDEFYFDFNSVLEKKGGIQGWYIGIKIHYTDNSDDWVTKWCGTTGGGVLQGHDDNGPETLKIPAGKPNSAKVVEYWEPYVFQNSNSDFATVRIENLKLYKKKSAELIVDGSITTKHLDTNSVRTGILTANSITSTMLSSDVILAKHLKVDNAMIDKLLLNDLLVNKIIAKEALVNKIKATTIDASKITSGVLGVGVRLGIGTTGYIEPYETGVRTVIPTEGSKGVAIHQTGNAHGNMEKGVNIYNLDDTVKPDNPELKYNETLLTVHGQVKIGLPLNSADVGGSDTRTLLGYAVGTNTANNTPVEPVGFTGDGTYNPTFSSIRWVGWFWGSTFGSRIAFDHGSKNNPETFMVRVAESYSDIKLKKNIEKSDVKALDIIENLKFKQFDWNDESKLTAGQPHVKLGLIAQEVELLASDLVTQANKYKELEHFKLTMYALKAIQELSEKINRLEKIINAS